MKEEERLQMKSGQLNFGSNMRGSADYRRHLSEVLIRRGLAQLEERREN